MTARTGLSQKAHAPVALSHDETQAVHDLRAALSQQRDCRRALERAPTPTAIALARSNKWRADERVREARKALEEILEAT